MESYDGALLFVSHDRYFINRFASRIWEMGGGTVTDYPMGFAQYRAMKAQEEAERAAARKAAKEQEQRDSGGGAERKKGAKGGRQPSVKRRLELCEREIAKTEERLSALDADIEENARNYERLTELAAERDAVQAELDGLYTRWEELSEEAEGQG